MRHIRNIRLIDDKFRAIPNTGPNQWMKTGPPTQKDKTMTMVCCDTSISRTAPAVSTPGEMASRAAGHLATKLTGLVNAFAARRRRRLDQRALEGLPFDLRKDLGWPGGDIDR
jgi:hypothetical protein